MPCRMLAPASGAADQVLCTASLQAAQGVSLKLRSFGPETAGLLVLAPALAQSCQSAL